MLIPMAYNGLVQALVTR